MNFRMVLLPRAETAGDGFSPPARRRRSFHHAHQSAIVIFCGDLSESGSPGYEAHAWGADARNGACARTVSVERQAGIGSAICTRSFVVHGWRSDRLRDGYPTRGWLPLRFDRLKFIGDCTVPRTVSSKPRLQLRQKSGGGFTKLFRSFSSAVAHAEQCAARVTFDGGKPMSQTGKPTARDGNE
jgi:hypothetical protein